MINHWTLQCVLKVSSVKTITFVWTKVLVVSLFLAFLWVLIFVIGSETLKLENIQQNTIYDFKKYHRFSNGPN